MAYKVLSNITHDGLLHTAGTVIDLPADVADNLKERGLVEETNEAVASSAVVDVPVSDEKAVDNPTDPLLSKAQDGRQEPSSPEKVEQPAPETNTPVQPASSLTELHLD